MSVVASSLPTVLLVSDYLAPIKALLHQYQLAVRVVGPAETIAGSYWGESEAGLVGNCLYVRLDTPVHSVLHEASHFVCMDNNRRQQLDRDAGGDYDEENAVCYLQIVLADCLPNIGRIRMQRDMDAWGYTFRLGSATAWFEQDADDARAWLAREGIIDAQQQPTWQLRR